ncbi:MAG: SDR family oxidoreductase [Burkholderiaceae bacterium]|nr:SDR family oxidoreductase [Burkholderiaceae bacterium]
MTQPLAIIFGGSRGIGAACVDALARDGLRVAFTYVTKPDEARALEKAGQIKAYAADVRDPSAVKKVFDDAARDFGTRPQVVVANAGINKPYLPIGQFSHENFRELMEVNVFGAFNVLTEAAREVLDGGAIIGITTSMVRNSVPGGGAYTATKAAVEGLLRSMAKELAVRGVRVNAVAPGAVDTDLFHSGKTDEAKQRAAAASPFNRIGLPHEVGDVVAYLASSRASWVHGQIIQPNGGLI